MIKIKVFKQMNEKNICSATLFLKKTVNREEEVLKHQQAMGKHISRKGNPAFLFC